MSEQILNNEGLTVAEAVLTRKLASIREVNSLEPIQGADLIEIAVIDGWKVVTKKGEFNIGDQCVYFEIDSFLPEGNPAWQFLVDKSSRKFEAQTGHKLRTIKLRGQISQGLVLPISAFSGLEVTIDEHKYDFADVAWNQGEDVTALLGIKKWEDQLPSCLQGQAEGLFPSFIRKTDEERCQNIGGKIFGYDDVVYVLPGDWIDAAVSPPLPGAHIMAHSGDPEQGWTEFWDDRDPLLHMTHWKPMITRPATASIDDEYEVSIKLDGSSMTAFVRAQFEAPFLDGDNQWQNPAEIGVCSRNLQLKVNEANGDNTFVKYFVDHLQTPLSMFFEDTGRSIALQGELMGPNIQGNREGFTKFEFYLYKVFDIDTQEYVSTDERDVIFAQLLALGAVMKHVPVPHKSTRLIDLGITNVPGLLKFAEGPSINHKVREGLVFKRKDGKFSFKAISNLFLLGEKD